MQSSPRNLLSVWTYLGVFNVVNNGLDRFLEESIESLYLIWSENLIVRHLKSFDLDTCSVVVGDYGPLEG